MQKVDQDFAGRTLQDELQFKEPSMRRRDSLFSGAPALDMSSIPELSADDLQNQLDEQAHKDSQKELVLDKGGPLTA